MKSANSGRVFHLVLAAVMTLSVVFIAIMLNSMHIPPIVPATAIISTDYQIESAVIMLLQKTQNNPAQKDAELVKEIMPGVSLKVNGKTEDGSTWVFVTEVKGLGLEKQTKIQVNRSTPDRLIYLPN